MRNILNVCNVKVYEIKHQIKNILILVQLCINKKMDYYNTIHSSILLQYSIENGM